MNFHKFHFRPTDRVLDIGCGAKPFIFATHLADISLNDNTGRFGLTIPVLNRPFFECSVEEMPFEDNYFDFVYCAHVLEHVKDPSKACQEIMRVGKRGYIECPRSWIEYVFESADHKWLVDHERNCLIFREKQDEERKDFLGLQYQIFDWLSDAGFRKHWNLPAIKAVRNVEFFWEGKFNYMVIPKAQRIDAGFKSGKNLGKPIAYRSRTSIQELKNSIYKQLNQQLDSSTKFK